MNYTIIIKGISQDHIIANLKKEYKETLEYAVENLGCRDLEDAKHKRLGGQSLEQYTEQELVDVKNNRRDYCSISMKY
tara:strand:+ start:1002 stop:1235 length:234 start_codon:yes stop_codon:yes gene_type:complete